MSIWSVLAVALLNEPSASRFELPQVFCRVRTDQLDEASGIVVSRRNPDLFWVHNDSGGEPRLFAIDTSGLLIAELRVQGADAKDWEDLAIGPDRSRGRDESRDALRPFLYIADTGNNSLDRGVLRVYRIPEPRLDHRKRNQSLGSQLAEVFQVSYTDGRFDCEGMVVHPDRPEVYLFTKESSGVGVYRFEAEKPSSQPIELRRWKSLSAGSVSTAAALSPDGARLALRFYWGICEWAVAPGEDVFARLDSSPRWLLPPVEKQGEGLCYSLDSRALYSVGEGSFPPIFRIGRPSAPSSGPPKTGATGDAR